MEIYFLGTGAGMPSSHRNVSSIALLMYQERGAFWMFDAGEGTQHQMMKSPLKPGKLEKLFVTHLHGDHVYGIPGLLASRSFQSNGEPLTLYGPIGIRRFVETCLETGHTHLTYPLSIVEIEREGHIFDDGQMQVTAVKLNHGITCFGYRIVEHDLPGKFLPERAIAYGIDPGPMFRELKAGKTVRLSDGRTVHGKDFVGPPVPGRKIAIAGDTKYCRSAVQLAEGVDVLVYESTFASNQADLAEAHFHSTAQQAACVAREAHARSLILTHISARYQKDIVFELRSEARTIFRETELAFDFSSFPVHRT